MPCCGSGSSTRRRAVAAAAVPDGRARRGVRRAGRRLPPRRARADRRGPGRRAPASRACCPPRSCGSSWRGSPGPVASCRTAGSTSCSRSGCGGTRTRSRPCTASREWTYRELNARANRIGRALLARGPAPRGRGRGGHRAQPGLDGRGHRRCSRPVGCTCRSSRTSRPSGSPPRCRGPGCRLVLTEPGSTTTLDRRWTRPARRPAGVGRHGLRRGPRRGRPRCAGGRGPARLHLLHLRLHGRAQGRDVRARRDAQPSLAKIDDLAIGEGAGGRRRPRRSASTSRCGSWSRRCWSAGGR